MSKSLVIVEDQNVFREALKHLLESSCEDVNVVADFSDGLQAVNFCKKNSPDLIIMDIQMPVLDGIEATKLIVSDNPDQKVLMLTFQDTDKVIQKSIEAGAKAFLGKDADLEELIEAVKSVLQIGYYYSPRVSSVMAEALATKRSYISSPDQLTSRELKIVELLCSEKTNSEISESLDISLRTVQWHRKNIAVKLGVKNTVGLVIYALKNKLVEM